MAAIDESDSPIRGFEMIHHPDGNYLRCRGQHCKFFRKVRRQIHLEQLLQLAAEHRTQCNAQIQVAPTVPKLPFIQVPVQGSAYKQLLDAVNSGEIGVKPRPYLTFSQLQGRVKTSLRSITRCNLRGSTALGQSYTNNLRRYAVQALWQSAPYYSPAEMEQILFLLRLADVVPEILDGIDTGSKCDRGCGELSRDNSDQLTHHITQHIQALPARRTP